MLRKNPKAYSLLELSIVIVIISILITGAMTASVGGINNAKIKTTKDKMDTIQKALGSFISINGRLPCPAPINVRKSATNYGVAITSDASPSATATACNGSGVFQSSSSSNLVYGMVPVVTLGLSKEIAEDGFESKIAYVVDKNFTVSANLNAYPDFSNNNFSIAAVVSSSNNVVIQEKRGENTVNAWTNSVFALISYGSNKGCAYGINSTTVNADTGGEESTNCHNGTSFDNVFLSKTDTSDTFDDMITSLTARQIIAVFDLYRLLPCNNSGDEAIYPNSPVNSKNAWFGQTVIGSACSGSDFDKNYRKKCGQVGSWIIESSCSLP